MRSTFFRRYAAKIIAVCAVALMIWTTQDAKAPIEPAPQPVPSAGIGPAQDPAGTRVPPTLSPHVGTTEVDAEVDRLLKLLPLEAQIGQLMIVALPDENISPAVVELIRTYRVGGLILFSHNVGTPQQARNLTTALQAIARENDPGIPLFLAVDQEGGVVNRVVSGATAWPSQMLLGATGSPAVVERSAELVAAELRALGINMNFAPVLDVNSNPDNPVIGTRSFGADPAQVALLGSRMIDAYQKAGIIAVGKHFPGHGDTEVDSHLRLPVVDRSLDELERRELVPFRAAIDAGVDALMTAHVAVPKLTGNQPATLSRQVLATLLREQLGFDGLIVTDDLEMGAIVEQHRTADAAVQAFKAGADLLLFRFDEQEQRRAYQLLLDVVHNDLTLAQQVQDSVRRILRVKVRRGLFQTELPPLSEVGSAAHQQAALETAIAGITLIRNDDRLIPVGSATAGKILVLEPNRASLGGAEAPLDKELMFGEAIARKHPDTQMQTFPLDPDQNERTGLLRMVESVSLVILSTYNIHEYPGQQMLANELLATNRPLIFVSLRLPYDLVHIPKARTYLATYDDHPPTLLAAAGVIFGENAPAGRLPVPLGKLYPIGHGLRGYATGEKQLMSVTRSTRH